MTDGFERNDMNNMNNMVQIIAVCLGPAPEDAKNRLTVIAHNEL